MAGYVRAILVIIAAASPPIAHADDPLLKDIDASFIRTNFSPAGIAMIREDPTTVSDVPGCKEFKRFSFSLGSRRSVVAVAICDDGKFGPRSYQATVDEVLMPFAPTDNASPEVKKGATIIRGDSISLSGNRTGRTFWMPLVGHGMVFVPTAIAATSGGKWTIFIQSDLDFDRNPDALQSMATLLRAVDSRI